MRAAKPKISFGSRSCPASWSLARTYCQDFLPNAGNGKRRQRYPDQWAKALRDMAALKPERLLPMHGAGLTDADDIQDRLLAHAGILESIMAQVIRGLNAGLRRDQVIDQVTLAAELAQRTDAREVYVSVKDFARMVAKEYGGWWTTYLRIGAQHH